MRGRALRAGRGFLRMRAREQYPSTARDHVTGAATMLGCEGAALTERLTVELAGGGPPQLRSTGAAQLLHESKWGCERRGRPSSADRLASVRHRACLGWLLQDSS